MPLLRKKFGTIEVDIRDDTGRRVAFKYGKVTVTLHFLSFVPNTSGPRTRQSVRRSAAKRYATHQDRCRDFGKGSVEDRRAHRRRRLVRTEHIKRRPNDTSSMCVFLRDQIWADFAAHSDWLKFEMGRSDWSCASCQRIIPYYRSNGRFWSTF